MRSDHLSKHIKTHSKNRPSAADQSGDASTKIEVDEKLIKTVRRVLAFGILFKGGNFNRLNCFNFRKSTMTKMVTLTGKSMEMPTAIQERKMGSRKAKK